MPADRCPHQKMAQLFSPRRAMPFAGCYVHLYTCTHTRIELVHETVLISDMSSMRACNQLSKRPHQPTLHTRLPPAAPVTAPTPSHPLLLPTHPVLLHSSVRAHCCLILCPQLPPSSPPSCSATARSPNNWISFATQSMKSVVVPAVSAVG